MRASCLFSALFSSSSCSDCLADVRVGAEIARVGLSGSQLAPSNEAQGGNSYIRTGLAIESFFAVRPSSIPSLELRLADIVSAGA